MYAVVATGGKQYRVGVGDTLDVERLGHAPDATVELRPVLLIGEDGSVTADRDALAKASVKARVLEQGRGRKLTVFKYRNKSGYRRKAGHRQHYTRIRVDEINP